MRTVHWHFLPAIAGVMALFTGCGGRPPAAYPGHNVILISIDTIRADHTEPLGDLGVRTPALAALAEDGAVFENAVTVTPLTIPAHATLFTGLNPVRHGVQDNFKGVLSEEADTLAERYSAAGYATAGVIGAILLSGRNGFGQGFDYYGDAFTPQQHQAIQPAVERKADEVFQKSREWIEQHLENQPDKPFFLFAHFYDPHMLYQPPEPFKSEYAGHPYRGEIAYTDSVVGKLLDYLKEKNLYDDAIVMAVGDHGEGLGDHGEKTHGLFLYDECLRVPWIVKLPASAGARGVRIAQQATLTDAAPTLAGLSQLEPLDGDGISLAPWLAGGRAAEPRWTFHDTQYPLTYNWSPLFAIRGPEWKYVHAPRPELYNLAEDPGETRNLLEERPEVADDLRSRLLERLDDLSSAPPFPGGERISSEQAEMLSSLGYVAGGGGEYSPGMDLPDPKDKIEIYNAVDRGLAHAAMNRMDEAIQLFNEAKEKDPENPTPYFNLGMVYLRMGEWARAAEETRKALEKSPGHVLIRLQLAKCEFLRENYESAESILNELAEERPNLAEVRAQMARLAMARGEWGEAMRHAEAASRLMPDMPGLAEAMEEIRAHL